MGASLSLTGWQLPVLLCLIAVLPVAAIVRDPRWVIRARIPALVGILLAGQVAAVSALGVVVNDRASFYPSWSDLWGNTQAYPRQISNSSGSLDTQVAKRAAHAPHGRGVVLRDVINDRINGVTTVASIYLPAAYRTLPATVEFPVLEVVGGASTRANQFRLVTTLDNEISHGRIPPFVAVMTAAPTTHDFVELCGDGMSRGAAPALLGGLLREQLKTQLRIRTDQNAWSLLGYGSATPCAIDLALGSPDSYAAVVDASGGVQAWRSALQSSVATLLDRRRAVPIGPIFEPPPPRLTVPLLLVTDGTLVDARLAASALIANTSGNASPQVKILRVRALSSWKDVLPRCLDWIATLVSGPLAPAAAAQVTVTSGQLI